MSSILAEPEPRPQEVRPPRFGVPDAAVEPWEQLRDALDRVTRAVPCSEAPADWFAGVGTAATEAAVAGCQTCTVLHLCRAYVLAAGALEAGVWGGLTEGERLELRRAERERAS